MFETQLASLKCQKTLDKFDIWLHFDYLFTSKKVHNFCKNPNWVSLKYFFTFPCMSKPETIIIEKVL